MGVRAVEHLLCARPEAVSYTLCHCPFTRPAEEGSIIFRVPRRTLSHPWDSTGPVVTQASRLGPLAPGLWYLTRSITRTVLTRVWEGWRRAFLPEVSTQRLERNSSAHLGLWGGARASLPSSG